MPQELSESEDYDVADDRLRLIFTCCHPALSPDAQIALTLREVCDLTTEQVAAAFLTTAPTLAQRIVRAKSKIRDARIPYEVPERNDLPERLASVLHVVYLVFNQGYFTRPDLAAEAIRLGGCWSSCCPSRRRSACWRSWCCTRRAERRALQPPGS